MMVETIILVGMSASAIAVFVAVYRRVQAGRLGLAIVITALIAVALLALLVAARPLGLDPMLAMSVALLALVPGLVGALAGVLWGWRGLRRGRS